MPVSLHKKKKLMLWQLFSLFFPWWSSSMLQDIKIILHLISLVALKTLILLYFLTFLRALKPSVNHLLSRWSLLEFFALKMHYLEIKTRILDHSLFFLQITITTKKYQCSLRNIVLLWWKITSQLFMFLFQNKYSIKMT